MNDRLVKRLAVLKVEHEKVIWELSAMNLKSGLEAGRRLTPAKTIHGGYGSSDRSWMLCFEWLFAAPAAQRRQLIQAAIT